jgi:serpin B
MGYHLKIASLLAIAAGVITLVILPLVKPAMPINLTPQDQILVERQNAFAFQLFRELMSDADGGNVFISPTSVALALSMSYNGAEGDTRAAMGEALGIENLTLGQVNNASESIIAFLNHPDRDVELSVANAIWAREGVEFRDEFRTTIERHFCGKAGVLDGDDKGGEAINRWVKRKTKGMVPKIIDHVGPDQVMFLVNAIYFKGDWTYPFDRDLTREREFTMDDGSRKMVPMMGLGEAQEFGYLKTPDYEAVELPYGESGRLGMYIYLPVDMDEFLEGLVLQELQMDEFEELTGTVVLPKFRVEYAKRLNGALKNLGMEIAFKPGADFTAMSDTQTWIDFVDHRAIIEVNERGTEAAGATVVVNTWSAGPKAEFQMRVDRPFFLVIRDSQSGAILFMGLIMNPQT